jgi:hypothetical protein
MVQGFNAQISFSENSLPDPLLGKEREAEIVGE